jgi:hypothetical protein
MQNQCIGIEWKWVNIFTLQSSTLGIHCYKAGWILQSARTWRLKKSPCRSRSYNRSYSLWHATVLSELYPSILLLVSHLGQTYFILCFSCIALLIKLTISRVWKVVDLFPTGTVDRGSALLHVLTCLWAASFWLGADCAREQRRLPREPVAAVVTHS